MRISDWSSDVCSSDLIQLKENAKLRTADTVGDGAFGYESHYCAVDRSADPTALACGYFQSGVRVFNVVDPLQPYEIAYYNPPAQTGKGLSLQHRSEEHTSELQSLMRISYAVVCLEKKT